MKYETFLRRENLTDSTIQNYVWTANYFNAHYPEVNKTNLLSYKEYLMEHYAPSTVNVRILGINKYLQYLGKEKLRLKTVRIQRKTFLENVISNADYIYLKRKFKKMENKQWYFAIWFMAATGARISELIRFKGENVEMGYVDLYTKGGKLLRIFIPAKLQKEALIWIEKTGRKSGFIFLNRFGNQITTRGLAQQIKRYAEKSKVSVEVVYPHSFRHRYAKNFLDKHNDLALLADLMGHENIDTTRIYLRKTSTEQRAIIDRVVTW